jgi:hypothetical protein
LGQVSKGAAMAVAWVTPSSAQAVRRVGIDHLSRDNGTEFVSADRACQIFWVRAVA